MENIFNIINKYEIEYNNRIPRATLTPLDNIYEASFELYDELDIDRDDTDRRFYEDYRPYLTFKEYGYSVDEAIYNLYNEAYKYLNKNKLLNKEFKLDKIRELLRNDYNDYETCYRIYNIMKVKNLIKIKPRFKGKNKKIHKCIIEYNYKTLAIGEGGKNKEALYRALIKLFDYLKDYIDNELSKAKYYIYNNDIDGDYLPF